MRKRWPRPFSAGPTAKDAGREDRSPLKNRGNVHEQKKKGPGKSMRTQPKLRDSISNFGQRITKELVSYPERTIAQFLPNLRKISD
jgi:hypothetical protein